jgi:hypothetical protein
VNRYLEKLAVRIHLYVHHQDESKKKWVAEGKPVPEGYVKSETSFYRRKGQKRK